MINLKQLLFLSIIILASSPVIAQEIVAREEINLFLEAIKAEDVETQLLSSPQLTTCKNQLENSTATDKNQELRECVATQLSQLDDSAIEQLAETFNLKAFDKQAAKTTKSIREYLDERLYKAIYGDEGIEDKLKTLKSKSVDHSMFFKLYQDQIGKNTLLSISSYCLENFGIENIVGTAPNQLDLGLINLAHPVFNSNGQFQKVFYYPVVTNLEQEGYTSKDEDYDTIKARMDTSPAIVSSYSGKELWQKAKEYGTCSGELNIEVNTQQNGSTTYKINPTSDCNPANFKRNIKLISALKRAELKIGATSPDQSFIKDRYKFCAAHVIKNMCEKYKCKNVYNETNSTQAMRDYCKDELGSRVTGILNDNMTEEQRAKKTAESNADLGSDSAQGQIACNLQQRLNEYRSTLKIAKDAETNFIDANKGTSTSKLINYNAESVYSGSSAGGQDSIDDLTSISAQDLGNAEELADGADNAAELREQCFESDGVTLKADATDNTLCASLFTGVDKEQLDSIRAESETETALVLSRIEKIKEDKDEVRNFLLESGMNEIVDRSDFESMDADELQKLIAGHYKSRRKAELDAIRARFDLENSSGTTSAAPLANGANSPPTTEQKVAQRSLKQMEQHKERMQNLFQYSNIVSSYLEITNDDNEVIGSNVTGRNLELDNPLASDDPNAYFQGTDQNNTGSSASTDSINYLGLLDTILEFNTDEDAN